ncbi:alpha/beta hydrolase family protein [Streptantibioticus silvisoli]|nr:prolyl oligopeptidase family serine peptidase [Streptantibioticus silvisoli]
MRLGGGEPEALPEWRGALADHRPLADGRLIAVIAADEATPEDERRLRESDDALVRGERVAYQGLRPLDVVSREYRAVHGLHDRHVIEAARPRTADRWRCSRSHPDIDPGCHAVALHMVDPRSGAVRDPGPARAGAHSPAWWHDGDARHLACMVHRPLSVGGDSVFDVTVADAGDVPGAGTAPGAGIVRGAGAVSDADTASDGDVLPWGTQERLSWKASDGPDVEGLLILPVGRCRADGPFPLVTLVHGGPDDRYADDFALTWVPSGQWLAAVGYAVLLPHPRGGQGRGQAFASAVTGTVGRDEWTTSSAAST